MLMSIVGCSVCLCKYCNIKFGITGTSMLISVSYLWLFTLYVSVKLAEFRLMSSYVDLMFKYVMLNSLLF